MPFVSCAGVVRTLKQLKSGVGKRRSSFVEAHGGLRFESEMCDKTVTISGYWRK